MRVYVEDLGYLIHINVAGRWFKFRSPVPFKLSSWRFLLKRWFK